LSFNLLPERTGCVEKGRLPMTFKRGLIVALVLAFAATPLFVQTAEAKVTKGQASVAKRSGKLYINQRQYDKAMEQYIIAAEGRPDDSEVQYYLGWLYSQKELFEEMNEHYNLATDRKWKKKVDADRKELWTRYYNMAVKGMNAQRFDFAMEQFDLAITINPNEADAYEGLAITHLNSGNSEGGIEMYQKAIELITGYNLDSLITGHHLDSLIVQDDIAKILEFDPPKPRGVTPPKAQSFFNLGGALMNVERIEEALEMFKKGHAIDPEEINILQHMSIAQYRLGDKEGAAESAEKALAIAGDDPKILNIAASIYLQAENYEKSAEILEKVVEIQPDNMDALFNLAIAYKQLDKGDRALDLFGKSVEANPTDADAWYQLGLLADKIDAYDKAIEAFLKVTELQASNARAWAALSRVYARKSEVSEGEIAAECVKKATEAFQMYEALQSQNQE
jgi:tetratricopeptide (TPR) repeat protein